METKIQKAKNATVVMVKGRMDAVASPDFEKQLQELIDKGERCFVMDFGELEYISSAGLRAILGIEEKLKQKKGKLFLCAVKDMVKEVFEISGFATVFNTYDTVDSALTQIQ